jgi:tetratricopeptide (TPR) repeat protein
MNEGVPSSLPAKSPPWEISPGEVPAELKKAFEVSPFEAPLWFNLGAIAHNAGDEEWAIRGFRRALVSDPTFAPAHAQIMVAAAKRLGPSHALTLARRLSRVVPASAQNRALITQYVFELGRDGEVGREGRMSLVLDPGAAGLYRLMALSVSRLQDMSSASSYLKRALALRPGWTDARLALAGAWFALLDYPGVLRELDRDSSGASETAEGAMLRGRALLELDRPDEAEINFAVAARMEPERQLSIDIVRQTMGRSLFQ